MAKALAANLKTDPGAIPVPWRPPGWLTIRKRRGSRWRCDSVDVTDRPIQPPSYSTRMNIRGRHDAVPRRKRLPMIIDLHVHTKPLSPCSHIDPLGNGGRGENAGDWRAFA